MLLPWVLPVDDLVVTVLDASDVATMVVVDVAAVTAVDVVVFAVVHAVDVAALVVAADVATVVVVAVAFAVVVFSAFFRASEMEIEISFPSGQKIFANGFGLPASNFASTENCNPQILLCHSNGQSLHKIFSISLELTHGEKQI